MSRRGSVRTVVVTVVVGVLGGVATAPAGAQFAAVDRPGPPLRPTAAEVATSLRCSQDVADAPRDPVLLLAGTTVNTQENFAWNHERALRQIGVPVCASDLPAPLDDNMGDIQLRGEYVVGAIREVHRRSGRKVALLGHSQGGMVGRWALRWWPDVRPMVSDVIGMAPSNHGTDVALPLCSLPCAPAFWQQRTGADFLRALNSGQETFAGVDYTAIYTRYDEVVVPAAGAALSGPGRIANVETQSVCPASLSEHLTVGTTDPVAWSLVRDALDHDGPADPARVDRAAVCAESLMPGADPATVLTETLAAGTALGTTIARTPTVPAEPELQCYVLASCVLPVAGGPQGSTSCRSTRRFAVRARRGLRAVRVTVAGRRVRVTRRAGRATAVVDLRGRRAGTVTVRIRGRTARGRVVTDTRRYTTCRARTRA